MKLVPILERLEQNEEFVNNPVCKETIFMCVDFYKRVGYTPPWICYYIKDGEEIVGSGAFKGKPTNNQVEIAYGTQPEHQRKGIATKICKLLVDLSLQTDPTVRITARTLLDNVGSCRVLEKNNFYNNGIVNDPEDGEVWEWVYKKSYLPIDE